MGASVPPEQPGVFCIMLRTYGHLPLGWPRPMICTGQEAFWDLIQDGNTSVEFGEPVSSIPIQETKQIGSCLKQCITTPAATHKKSAEVLNAAFLAG